MGQIWDGIILGKYRTNHGINGTFLGIYGEYGTFSEKYGTNYGKYGNMGQF